MIPTPTFGEYENQSHLAGGRTERLRIDEDGTPLLRDSDLHRAKALFLCNPNNPTDGCSPKIRFLSWQTDARRQRYSCWWMRPS